MKALEYKNEEYVMFYDDDTKQYKIKVGEGIITVEDLHHFRTHLDWFAKALDELKIPK